MATASPAPWSNGMVSVQPVILCGGSGTRLWPLSRSGFPKQFLCLTGDESLFQLAAKRLMALKTDDIQVASPLIISNEEHRFLASEQLREAGIELGMALLEPIGRNTAAALTLAALAALNEGANPVLVVTPADQTVTDQTAYTYAMQTAIREAIADSIVMLGITPDRPETGYGYIQIESSSEKSALVVRRFVEKPDTTTAQTYLDEGSYYWNAGIFVLKASIWLEALEAFRPNIAKATRIAWDKRAVDANPASHFVRPGKEEFSAIPSESIDYAVMESCPGSHFPIRMMPLDAGWSDLGTWDAVWRTMPKDINNNAHLGDVLTTGSRDTLVHATSRLVSLVGVENLIVIETADAVLVANKTVAKTSRLSSTNCMPTAGKSTRFTAKCTVHGGGTIASITATVSRSSTSRSTPRPVSVCKSTITVRSTG